MTSIQPVLVTQEVHSRRGQARRMRIIAGRCDGCECEEAIIEKGAFKGEVDQGVEEVPNKEDAELGSCRGMQEVQRSGVCYDEDRKGCEKGEDGGTIDD